MAKRESQGLQIALIIFVLITIALGITSFIFFKKFEEQEKLAIAAGKTEKAAIKERNDAQREFKAVVKDLTGMENATLAEVRERKTDDMHQYDDTFDVMNSPRPDGLTQTYPVALQHLTDAILAQHRKNITLAENIERLEADKEQIQIAANKRVETEQQNAQTAAADLTAQVEKYGAKYEDHIGTYTKFEDDIRDGNVELRAVEDKARQEKDKLIEQIVEKEKQRVAAVNEVKENYDHDFEKPDGKITHISAAQKMVWINLGSADGLRRQIPFSVFDRDATEIEKNEPKGSIEIVRVMGPHRAQARITRDYLTDPLLPGDKIFNTSFNPGRAERFGIAGFIDIDGDGRSDLQLLRSIIRTSGGEIDAEVNDEGQRTGKLSIKTKYLILGDLPTDEDAKIIEEFSALNREATNEGVQTISLSKFLEYIGFQGEEKTVRLGRGANDDDFKARPDGVPRNSGPTQFRKRRPPERKEEGAY